MRSDREFGAIRVVAADWPMLVVEFPEKRPDDASLQATFGHFEAVMRETLKSGEHMFFITDLTRMRELPTPRQRAFTGEWNKRNASLSQAVTLGMATVAPSAILRGIMTAVFWLHRPARPMSFVATRRDAIVKGVQTFDAQKITLPLRFGAYRNLPVGSLD